MATPTKKTSTKSVTFAQEIVDQNLLSAIEEELAEGHFSSFSELCKQALQVFLFEEGTTQSSESTDLANQPFVHLQSQIAYVSEQIEQINVRFNQAPATGSSDTVADEVARLSQQSKLINQQLTQLQRQLEDFGSGASAGLDPKLFRQLENQIGYLTQQVDQIDGTTGQLATQIAQFSALEVASAGLRPDHLGQIEDQITDLMRQVEQIGQKTDRFLAHLQQVLSDSSPEDEAETEDGAMISPEIQRLEQLEVRLASLLDRMEQSLVQRGALLLSETAAHPVRESTPIAQDGFDDLEGDDRSISQVADPLLNRLSAFLEDF